MDPKPYSLGSFGSEYSRDSRFLGLEGNRHAFATSYHSTIIMSDVPTTIALPAARPKPLIGDGSGRYRICIVGNSGALLSRTHTYE